MQRLGFDRGWRFRLGEIPDGVWREKLDDSDWRSVDLPHDWSIELPRDPASAGGSASGYFPAGVGWYHITNDWDQALAPAITDNTAEEFGVHVGGGLRVPRGPRVGADRSGRVERDVHKNQRGTGSEPCDGSRGRTRELVISLPQPLPDSTEPPQQRGDAQ